MRIRAYRKTIQRILLIQERFHCLASTPKVFKEKLTEPRKIIRRAEKNREY